jgi:hypothetical protein
VSQPKSMSSDRRVEPPSSCMAMLRDREKRRHGQHGRNVTVVPVLPPLPGPFRCRRWARLRAQLRGLECVEGIDGAAHVLADDPGAHPPPTKRIRRP